MRDRRFDYLLLSYRNFEAKLVEIFETILETFLALQYRTSVSHGLMAVYNSIV